MIVVAALLGAASPAAASACYPVSGRIQVTAGHAVSTGLRCVDGADAPVTPTDLEEARAAPGLTLSIGALGDGTFELRISATAEATPDVYNFPVVVNIAGAGRADFRLVVTVVEEPAPRCSAVPAIEVRRGMGPTVIATDCRAPGGAGTIDILARPRHGALRIAGNARTITYEPDRGFAGPDAFTFRVTNSYGSSSPVTVRLKVRAATTLELSAAYAALVCPTAPVGTFCRPGNGRRTAGGPGTGKVSHRHWPAVAGVIISARTAGATIRGGSRTDELLGHHGSDRLFGRGGDDILWGDQDPIGNTRRQSDVLVGGPGRDFIYTSHGRNTVRGGTGNDFIWAFYGRGTIDCGPGTDTVRLSGRTGAYRLRSCERRGTF